jgi:hypothetical protein
MQQEQMAFEVHPMLPYPFGRFRRCASVPTRRDVVYCAREGGRERACSDLPPAKGLYVREVELAFAVSRNEEYVHLWMSHDGRTMDMGDRSYHYLLLILARKRLEDRAAGLPEPSCGWADLDDWVHDPSLSPPRVNLEIFRIRRQFLARGVADGAQIIERRARMGQLRIGAERLSIVRA